ncbi:hypothetical protein K239x_50790 [Planctomycetes bacterium K23_9]|uniref:Uncharacterized protein n=1 Tax=Stieleria marina TaxID=1930275 RepID=A0A517P141_9BACT|nr:hypothetical protein K239x_50790 [Planctomycetes bacterium K23_9]
MSAVSRWASNGNSGSPGYKLETLSRIVATISGCKKTVSTSRCLLSAAETINRGGSSNINDAAVRRAASPLRSPVVLTNSYRNSLYGPVMPSMHLVELAAAGTRSKNSSSFNDRRGCRISTCTFHIGRCTNGSSYLKRTPRRRSPMPCSSCPLTKAFAILVSPGIRRSERAISINRPQCRLSLQILSWLRPVRLCGYSVLYWREHSATSEWACPCRAVFIPTRLSCLHGSGLLAMTHSAQASVIWATTSLLFLGGSARKPHDAFRYSRVAKTQLRSVFVEYS